MASTAAQATAASACVTSGLRGGEGARGVGLAQGAERGGDEHGIAGVGDDARERLGAAQASERAHGGELHLVLLVGEREDHRVGGRLASRPGQRVDGGAAHARVVVGQRALEQLHVLVAQRLGRGDGAEQDASERQRIVSRLASRARSARAESTWRAASSETALVAVAAMRSSS